MVAKLLLSRSLFSLDLISVNLGQQPELCRSLIISLLSVTTAMNRYLMYSTENNLWRKHPVTSGKTDTIKNEGKLPPIFMRSYDTSNRLKIKCI